MAREQQVCHKEIRVELLDKEELLEVCKQETFLIKSGVRKITQVGVHETNYRWRDDSGKSMDTVDILLLRWKALLEDKWHKGTIHI